MGLDGVELVMEFEDEFDVTFEDEVAGSFKTIGDVARHITWQFRSKWPRASCPTSKNYYETRKLLCEKLSVNRCDIKPSSMLNEVIPVRLRRKILKSLRSRLPVVPELEPPGIMNSIGFVLALIIGVSTGVLSGVSAGLVVGIISGFISLYVMLMAYYFISLPFTVCFPKGCETVGDLVRRSTLDYEPQDEIDVDVLNKVRSIVSEQMYVPIEELSAQTNFVDDLKI